MDRQENNYHPNINVNAVHRWLAIEAIASDIKQAGLAFIVDIPFAMEGVFAHFDAGIVQASFPHMILNNTFLYYILL